MPKTNIFTLLTFLTLFLSCNRDDDNADQVPRIPTDIQINLNLPQYNPLLNPGGWVYALGGSQGIIIYRISQSDFGVFDRHCTYQVVNSCRVNVNAEDNITAADTECCGSVFNIVDGLPSEGPALRPLQAFEYQFNSNTNVLRVYN